MLLGSRGGGFFSGGFLFPGLRQSRGVDGRRRGGGKLRRSTFSRRFWSGVGGHGGGGRRRQRRLQHTGRAARGSNRASRICYLYGVGKGAVGTWGTANRAGGWVEPDAGWQSPAGDRKLIGSTAPGRDRRRVIRDSQLNRSARRTEYGKRWVRRFLLTAGECRSGFRILLRCGRGNDRKKNRKGHRSHECTSKISSDRQCGLQFLWTAREANH